MKKILILVPDLSLPGGVSNYYNSVRLDQEKNIHYFAVNKGKSRSALRTAWRLFINYGKFFFLLVKDRYELVHVNPSLDRRSFYRDSLFIILAKILKRQTLVFFRGWTDSFEDKIKRSRVKSFLFKMSYAKADKYIVLGQVFKLKLIALGVPEKTEFFIESTVADSSYLNELNLESKCISFNEKRKFLFLSRIEKEKGVYIAVDAFSGFLSRYPEKSSCLTIAGDGPELAAVKKYVTEKKLSNIEFAGHVGGEQKKKLLITSHVLLFPTYYGEGIPNSILESMLYGMPIVSRTVGGIPDIIQNDVNGYLSESLDPGVFLDFISRLTSDIDLYKRISNNNYITAKEKYTTERVRERILEIYSGFN